MLSRLYKPLVQQFSRPLASQSRGFGSSPTTHSGIKGIKRFYKQVSYKERTDLPGHFHILLDGRTLKTPAQNELLLPSEPLALAVAAEWDMQVSKVEGIMPSFMPLMTLVSTTLDQVTEDRTSFEATCMKFLRTDTTLFFAPAEERILLKRQQDTFHPLHSFLNEKMNINIQTNENDISLIAVPTQTDETTETIHRFLRHLSPYSLACVHAMTVEMKSILLAIAALLKYQPRKEEGSEENNNNNNHNNHNHPPTFSSLVPFLKEASSLEEIFNKENWGEIPNAEGGHRVQENNLTVGLASASWLLDALKFDAQEVIDDMESS